MDVYTEVVVVVVVVVVVLFVGERREFVLDINAAHDGKVPQYSGDMIWVV